MSTSYSATLVAGVMDTEVFTKTTQVVSVTRYDSLTGAPFQKTVETESRFFNGSLIRSHETEYETAEAAGLERFSTFVGNREASVVGVEICRVSEYDSWVNAAGNIEMKVAEAAEKLPGLPVRVLLVMHAG